MTAVLLATEGRDPVSPSSIFLWLFATCFGFLYGLWPLVMLASLTWGRRPLANLWAAWLCCVLGRLLLMAFPPATALPFRHIPEPLSTVLLLASGPLLYLAGLARTNRRRAGLWRHVDQSGSVQDLRQISPDGFEDLVVEWLRAEGHEATRAGGQGDHGIDVVVKAGNGEKWIVQCKRWQGQVGEPVVRDFYGAMHHENADRGLIVTTGRFTPQACDWARGKPISLITGHELLAALRKARGGQEPKADAVAAYQLTTAPARPTPTAGPRCPLCGSAMVIKTARRGAHQGERFYSCSNYPRCRGLLPWQG